jgi:hypothetical protein
MLIEKCDLCGGETTKRDYVRVEYHRIFRMYGFCDNCAVPILVFLNDNNLIESVK